VDAVYGLLATAATIELNTYCSIRPCGVIAVGYLVELLYRFAKLTPTCRVC
jgi:hypothetical protein